MAKNGLHADMTLRLLEDLKTSKNRKAYSIVKQVCISAKLAKDMNKSCKLIQEEPYLMQEEECFAFICSISIATAFFFPAGKVSFLFRNQDPFFRNSATTSFRFFTKHTLVYKNHFFGGMSQPCSPRVGYRIFSHSKAKAGVMVIDLNRWRRSSHISCGNGGNLWWFLT